jgi:glutamate dehydrogenase
VGVGDMSGDVFGNGMLLSEHIRLVAAFDHRHIFLDPPRTRRFPGRTRGCSPSCPRSSWDDYDRAAISAGGGVFPRTLKSIPLSPQVRGDAGTEADSATPDEVMHAILKRAGRTALFRRHRLLREGARRKQRRCRRQGE